MSKNFKIYVLKEPDGITIRYVGLTSQSLKQRYDQHLRDKDKTHKATWVRSLKKLGLKPVVELLEDGLSLDEANSQEIFYIKKFNKDYNLTNHAIGGNGSQGYKWTDEQKARCSLAQKKRFQEDPLSNGHRKDIFQYTIDGKFIKKFRSSQQAEKSTGISQGNIIQCCIGKTRRSAGGFLWSYKKSDTMKIRPHRYDIGQISQYSKDNLLMDTFISLEDASISTGIKTRYIRNAINGNCKTAKGFIWKSNTQKND